MPLLDDKLVGRERELAQLDVLLNRVTGGHASVVVATGEAGVGKTAVLEALAELASKRGFAVAVGRCAASEAPPYWPWLRMLRSLESSDEKVVAPSGSGRAALFADRSRVRCA